MENFQKLRVWQEAKQLVVSIYEQTAHFPPEEKFGLTMQMRRAAISVASNIAEGSKKNSIRDRKRFHAMAETSLEELKSQVLIAVELRFLRASEADFLLGSARAVGGMLTAFNRVLK